MLAANGTEFRTPATPWLPPIHTLNRSSGLAVSDLSVMTPLDAASRDSLVPSEVSVVSEVTRIALTRLRCSAVRSPHAFHS